MSNTNIQDIDLSALQKKRFRIDGDDNKILELNTSDLNVVTRLSDSYPKLHELAEKVSKVGDYESEDLDTESELNLVANRLTEVDKEMRDLIDFIFDSNVCEICSPSGSMYDPINGTLRYEIIIGTLVNLYDKNLTAEYKKLNQKLAKHTSKYTKAKKTK